MLQKFNPIFAYIPIENMIRYRQAEYCQALNQANAAANSACFVEFIFQKIFDSLHNYIQNSIHGNTSFQSSSGRIREVA